MRARRTRWRATRLQRAPTRRTTQTTPRLPRAMSSSCSKRGRMHRRTTAFHRASGMRSRRAAHQPLIRASKRNGQMATLRPCVTPRRDGREAGRTTASPRVSSRRFVRTGVRASRRSALIIITRPTPTPRRRSPSASAATSCVVEESSSVTCSARSRMPVRSLRAVGRTSSIQRTQTVRGGELPTRRTSSAERPNRAAVAQRRSKTPSRESTQAATRPEAQRRFMSTPRTIW